MAWALFGLALLIRCIHLLLAAKGPTFYTPAVDAQLYDRAARGLLAGKGWTEDFFLQGFLYPAFLAFSYNLSKGSILFAKLLQAVIGSTTVVLAAGIAKRRYGVRAALATGTCLCLYGPLLFFEGELLATGLGAFFSILCLMLFIDTARQPTRLRFSLLGVTGVLAILTRGPLAAPFLAGCAWLALHLYRTKAGRRIWVSAAALPICFLITAMPPAFLCYRTTGEASIFPARSGINIYVGNHADRAEMVGARPGHEWQAILWRPSAAGIKGIWNENRYFQSAAWKGVAADPVGFLTGLVGKSLEMATSRELPRNFDPYLFRDWNPILSLLMWKVGAFGFPFGLFFPIALLGYWVRRRETPGVLVLYPLAYALSIILVFVSSRYRALVIPVLAIPFGAGAAFLIEAAGDRRWKGLAIALAAIAALGAAISLPTRFDLEGDPVDFAIEMKLFAAEDAARRGDPQAAVRFAREAVDLRPDTPQSLTQLGVMKLRSGDRPGAERAFLRAVELAPGLTAARINLGTIYAETGKLERAVSHLKAALRSNPFHASAHANLGAAMAVQKRVPDAIYHLETATRLDPWLGDAQFNLAILLAQNGRPGDAIRAVEQAVRAARAEGNQDLLREAEALLAALSGSRAPDL